MDVSDEYAGVLKRCEGGPDALAGILYQESKYFQPGLGTPCLCRWVAFSTGSGQARDVKIRDCRLTGSSRTPQRLKYPRWAYRNVEYQQRCLRQVSARIGDPTCTAATRRTLASGICRLKNGSCAVDEAMISRPPHEGGSPPVRHPVPARSASVGCRHTVDHRRPQSRDDSRYWRIAPSKQPQAGPRKVDEFQGGSKETAYRFIGEQMRCDANDQFREGHGRCRPRPSTKLL